MEKQDFIKWAKKLQQSYIPNEFVRNDLSNIEIIAIIGPTGVGKTTIIDNLGYPYVKSDVSRKMREDEKKDENYHFRSDYLEIVKEIKNGEFVQFIVSNSGDFYGTRNSSYPKSGRCVMAITAQAIPSFRDLGFRKITPIYIMPPGYVEWMRRVGKMRSVDIDTRVQEAIISIKSAIHDPEYKFVLNDNLKLALNDIKNIIANKQIDEHRATLARETADILLERLGDQDDDMYFENGNL